MILKELEEIIKLASLVFSKDSKLTYNEIFELSGIASLLKEEVFIDTLDLKKEHVDLFYNELKKFIKLPLYSDISISKTEDLKFLRQDEIFKNKIRGVINKIEANLNKKPSKVEYVANWLKENYEPGDYVSLEKIKSQVKYDKATILFILDDLLKDQKISSFNGVAAIL